MEANNCLFSNTAIWVLAGVGVVVLAIVLLRLLGRGLNQRMIAEGLIPISRAQAEQLQNLIVQDQLLAAVKQYREWTGSSLVMASNACEQIRQHGWDAAVHPGRYGVTVVEASPPPITPTQDVEELVRQGRLIDAVKLYRQLHGTDLQASKVAVDAIMERQAQEGTQ